MTQTKNVRTGKRILLISPSLILRNPSQPRTFFKREELYSLADSISANGILQPLTVRSREDGRYELVAGERRLRAARIAGLTEVPCVEVNVSDRASAVLALLENLQRQDLNFFEEAEGIEHLIKEWGLTQQETARKLGKSQSAVANKLRILKISNYQREKILQYGLSERHARALLKLTDDDDRLRAIEYIAERHLNVSQAELYIQNMNSPAVERKRIIAKACDVRLFFNTITKAVNTMRQSGIEASTDREEQEDYTVYTIKIHRDNDKNIA